MNLSKLQQHKRHALIVLAIAIGGVVVILITMTVLIAIYGKVIYPHTSIVGMDIGLEERTTVEPKIDQILSDVLGQEMIVVVNESTYEFLPSELGVSYDIETTHASIPTIGQTQGVISGLINLVKPKEVLPVVAVDTDILSEKIGILAYEIAPKDAYFVFDAETREVSISPEEKGQDLDFEGLVEMIKAKYENLDDGAVYLPISELGPDVTEEDLSPFTEVAKSVFSNDVQVWSGKNSWTFSPANFSQGITFETKKNLTLPGLGSPIALDIEDEIVEGISSIATEIDIRINESQIEEFVVANQIRESVEEPSASVVIEINEEGVITFSGAAEDGLAVDVASLKKSLELALESGIGSIDLTTKIIQAGVEVPEELQELGIQELIGNGYSNFYGSPYNRQMNISVGMTKFNGILIAPDETFSFVTQLGPVDAANGYYKELVISGNETIPEYGGGLCQVSSTMFKAILDGGLPIVSRTEHSYAVSYYAYPDGYGLDATIYQPWPDLQFTNDTGAHILVQAYAEGNDAYFKFYGTSDGRTVDMEGPYYSNYSDPPPDVIIYTTELEPGERKQEDSAHTGFTVDWYRTVVYPDGEEVRENIHSNYQAWPAKYLVGIEEEAESE